MTKPTGRQFLSSGRWMQKAISASGRLARRETEPLLAEMLEFRRYVMGFLAEALGHMGVENNQIHVDDAMSDKIQHQQTCLVAFVQGLTGQSASFSKPSI